MSFVWLYRFFLSVLNTNIILRPETMIRWHCENSELIGVRSPQARGPSIIIQAAVSRFLSSRAKKFGPYQSDGQCDGQMERWSGY